MSYSPRGFVFLQDSQYTTTNRLSVNNARVQLTNDGLGANTSTLYAPQGMDSLWVNNELVPPYQGFYFNARIDFQCEPGGVSDYMEVQADIGTPGSPINILSRTQSFTKTGVNAVSIGVPIFCLATFVANNGKLYFDTSGSGDNIEIWGISLYIGVG